MKSESIGSLPGPEEPRRALPSARKPGAESAHSGVGGSSAAGAAPLSGSLRVHAPAGTLVRINAAELPLAQRDRIAPTACRIDLEFPDMERVEITGTAYSHAALALDLLKTGNVLCAITEIEASLREARRGQVHELPSNVRQVLARLDVAATLARGLKSEAVVSALSGITARDLQQLSRAQCVEVVERLAGAIEKLRGGLDR